MKRPELYHKTVGILVDAYFNDTLVHGDYCGCAVGNMIAANLGIKLIRRRDGVEWGANTMKHFGSEWYDLKYGTKLVGDKGEIQIKSTGYTYQQILDIEKAFELAEDGNTEEEYIFNGLMAVIDVLDQIHENTDTNVTQETKNKFNKKLQLQ